MSSCAFDLYDFNGTRCSYNRHVVFFIVLSKWTVVIRERIIPGALVSMSSNQSCDHT